MEFIFAYLHKWYFRARLAEPLQIDIITRPQWIKNKKEKKRKEVASN